MKKNPKTFLNPPNSVRVSFLDAICIIVLFLFHLLKVSGRKLQTKTLFLGPFIFWGKNQQKSPFSAIFGAILSGHFLRNRFQRRVCGILANISVDLSLSEESGPYIFRKGVTDPKSRQIPPKAFSDTSLQNGPPRVFLEGPKKGWALWRGMFDEL